MRLKTLPLAISGALTGNIIALFETNSIQPLVFSLSITTAVLLQILSNFANDYGDFTNGADQSERTDRLLTTGQITVQQMKFAVYFTGFLALLFGILLLLIGLKTINSSFYILLTLGLLGILAAYFYTSGKRPYGYIGLGDLSVFLFFGIFSVIGSFYLQTQHIESNIWYLAIACGLLSVGVLNINNIRDIESDKTSGKYTIPVKIGKKRALMYHFTLLILSFVSLIFYVSPIINFQIILVLMIILVLLMFHYNKLTKCENRIQYNQQLKQLSLSTLFIIILFCSSLFYLS
jgi:1,4-dihydroxy-2-naphthoate octaprenyltransferase